MRTADFDYELPVQLIAQQPAAERDQSRLLVLERSSGQIAHWEFRDLAALLQAGDLLVLNDARVIPARLRGVNARTGGQFELLLLEEVAKNDWWVMLRPGRRARAGTQIRLLQGLAGQPGLIEAAVVEVNAEGHRRVQFSGTADILKDVDRLGEVPLPPYINRPNGALEVDRERYQTVYAQATGSVAAPTAGLHFTPELLGEIRAGGVQVRFLTLHVGLGTFAPVKAETLQAHTLHEERFELNAATVEAIESAKRNTRRVIAVGTTTVRVLEGVAAQNGGRLVPTRGRTRIFIYPPYDFKVVDALLTNFHLPRSTLLMLVSAFAAPNETRGRDLILRAYAEAIAKRYRFFSYGDAMLLV